MGIDYDASTDLWSYACMVFELITGDFLFNPRPGSEYKKNDDHLALFMEMLGPCSKKLAMQGNMFDHYFARNPRTGKHYFRRIHDLKRMDLEKLLIYRYQLVPHEAKVLSDFLLRILKWDPKDRPTAQQMLEHEWFRMDDNYKCKMSEMESKLYELKDQTQQIDNHHVDVNFLMDEKANLLG
jgi:serine/threonine-protein kinase SRPK3